MKKLLILLPCIILSVVVTAQPKSIGARFGYGIEFTYQHSVGKNFIEADLGYNYARGFNVTAKYDFVVAKPDWTPKGTWEIYVGPGVFLGTDFNSRPFMFGISAQVGLSYTFHFPLQLSADLMPTASLCVGTPSGVAFNIDGLFGFVPTIGVRYSFGR